MPSIEWNRQFGEDVGRLRDGERYWGDRWGPPESSPVLQRILERFLLPFVSPARTALEIGSGGGRFTQFLLPFRKVYCADLNPQMFEYLRQRFPDADHLEFVLTPGDDLPNVPEGSIDFLWSFGTVVHIEEPELVGYLEAIKRVLSPDARATIHYSDKDKEEARRSDELAQMTRKRFHELLDEHGYQILDEDPHSMGHSNVVAFRVRREQHGRSAA